jgi:hypothetical protein
MESLRWLVLSHLRLTSALVVLSAGLLAWVFCKPLLPVFPLDDAYIQLAYVRCFAQSGHFCFNPGEPSLGTTSPLYVLLLVPFFRAGLDPYRTERLIGLLCSVATALLSQALSRRACRESGCSAEVSEGAGLLAGVLVAWNGAILWMAFSGMETPLLLAVSLGLIWSFTRRGYDVVTGAVGGVLFLVRAPGAVIAVILLAVDLAAGRWRRCASGALVTGVIALPMLVTSYLITGGILPTTATGKLLTYVSGGYDFDEMLHFVGRFAELQKYTPVNYLLFVVIVAGAARWWTVTPERWASLRQLLVRRSTAVILALWGTAHFLTYLWAFRTVGQQGRYLVEEQTVFAILGAVALARFLVMAPRRQQRARSLATGAVLLAATVGMLPAWRAYLQRNVEHVEASYLRMGRYLADHTDENARIAAFDIGVARYVGDRYVIDLGGLLDPRSWPCLRLHECGPYARARGATHFLYSREPDADNITGIGRSEAGQPEILRQTPIYETRYPDYAAPTLTHSLWLQLSRVDGWFPRTDAGIRAAFSLPQSELPGAPSAATGVALGDGLELVGGSLDTHELRYMRGYPYALTMTLDYRVRAQPTQLTWLHVGIFYVDENDEEHVERISTELHVLASEGVILPGHWPVGEVVRVPQHLRIPYQSPGRRWSVRVAVSSSPFSDERYPQMEHWHDVGTLVKAPSEMRPRAPL